MFNLQSLGIKIAAASIVVCILISGFFFIRYLNSQLEAAEMRQAQLQSIVESQQLAMDTLRADVTRIGQIQTRLFSELSSAQSTSRDLERRFTQDAAGRERNFQAAVNRSPRRAEERVNIGTRDALRCNELVTGSPMTPEEREGKIVNTICPELLRAR
jgi:hypothetical protein